MKYLIPLLLLLTSCASTARIPHKGMSRVRQYEFRHPDVPTAFDGFRIVFATDFHYKSKFKAKQLDGFVQTLNTLDVDLLLMGGDYHAGCQYIPELAARLTTVETTHGIIGVMGNHDYARCYDELLLEMSQHGIKLLEHENDTICRDGQYIIISGVRNPFDLKRNGTSPTLALSSDDFVLLLTHTPDYVEDADITHTDLALAGHTHGGQVTFFGLCAPVTNSKYGQRFRSGMKRNSRDVPIIISNGLGTSRRNVRMFAPSEVVLIVLRAQ